jgi:hypothetical protein
VALRVTAKGQRLLRSLSDDHERELFELVPRLIGSLTRIRNSKKRGTPKAWGALETER